MTFEILPKICGVWARQAFEWSGNYPHFESGLSASPVRGREGLAALVTPPREVLTQPWQFLSAALFFH